MEEEPIIEKAAAAGEEEEQVLLPGFRFHPTDEELLSFYLRRKVQRRAFSIDLIREVDIYKHDPWDLPKASCGGEREWYFFCLRGRKYRNSIRPNRVTGSGFWKATGIDRAVHGGRAGDVCIGLKKSLVYYRGSAGKGSKTDWMMHEFRHPPPSDDNNNNSRSRSDRQSLQEAEIWTICRIFKRTSSHRKGESPTKFNKKTNIASSESSSKASSFESDLGPASSGYLHEEGKSVSSNNNYNNNNNNKYYQQNKSDKSYQNKGQYLCDNYSFEQLSPAAAPPLYCEIAPPATTTASHEMNDWFSDGNWDELERIVELMWQNDQSVTYQYQY